MEEKSSKNWLLWLIITILACAVTGLVVYNNIDSIDRMMSGPSSESQIISELAEDTIPETYSIAEILQWREHTKELQRIDNVYLNMPEVILIDILLQHGTSLSSADIVYIYESNPETYNLVQSGARAQQYLDSIKVNEPDELPQKAKPDSILPMVYE